MGLHQSCGRLIIDTSGHTVTLIGARQSSIIYLSLGGSLTVAPPGLNINNKQTTTDHHSLPLTTDWTKYQILLVG